jgi:HPt (histidine-containing phosphotransfer) domain-containing protein
LAPTLRVQVFRRHLLARVGDSDAIHWWAHTLKGSAGNFGAHPVVAPEQRLEARAQEGDVVARETCSNTGVEAGAMLAILAGKGESLPCAS